MSENTGKSQMDELRLQVLQLATCVAAAQGMGGKRARARELRDQLTEVLRPRFPKEVARIREERIR